jgi:hypothetical protein
MDISIDLIFLKCGVNHRFNLSYCSADYSFIRITLSTKILLGKAESQSSDHQIFAVWSLSMYKLNSTTNIFQSQLWLNLFPNYNLELISLMDSTESKYQTVVDVPFKNLQKFVVLVEVDLPKLFF